MNDGPSPEISIFLAAIEKESKGELTAFLDEACGGDDQVRARVENLVAAHRRNESFLDRPAPELDRTIDVDRGAMDAGLAPAFSVDKAVVVGGGHSVLKSLSKCLPSVPQVSLQDSQEDRGAVVQPSSSELPGRQDHESRYQLLGEIARGGMGAIIKGRDTDLGRDLAIKVLLDSHKERPEVIHRFVEEAQIGGQLQHPGIVPVYELGQLKDQRPFFSMKLVKGETLAALLAKRKDFAEDRPHLLGIFEQVCQTMAYAHSKGVIHRDLKPANIMVGAFGEVQVMDWGLSKVLDRGGVADERKSQDQHREVSVIATRRSVGSEPSDGVGSETQMGSVMGTPAYMPPEQALGEVDRLDRRADVFGLGAILAEILTGKPPYVAEDSTQVFRLASRGKLDECFARLDASGAERELIELAKLAMSPEPDQRPSDASQLSAAITAHLEGVQERLKNAEIANAEALARAEGERRRRRLQFAIAGLLLLIVAGSAAVAIGMNRMAAIRAQESSQLEVATAKAETERLARESAESQRRVAEAQAEAAEARIESENLARTNFPAIREMAEKQDYFAAFELARKSRVAIPQDETLQALIESVSVPVSIDSLPSGAQVRVRPAVGGEWTVLGKTPLQERLPLGMTHFSLEKPGFVESLRLELIRPDRNAPIVRKEFVLSADSDLAPGMVRVPRSTDQTMIALPGFPPIKDIHLAEYSIDRYEVTNQEFQHFVDQGGYRTREYWTHEFRKDGDLVSWNEAIDAFRDTTGQLGPSTWVSGRHPPGEEDHPVRGVSWYEAAAYAEFSNKRLPTIYHWYHASGTTTGPILAGLFATAVAPASNVGNRDSGPAPVGEYLGIGPYGTFDMAGNVKEWCFNEATDGERYALGGAWHDADVMMWEPDARSAFDRSDDLGFRCLQSQPPGSPNLSAKLDFFTRDYSQERPCSDEDFAEILQSFSYDADQNYAQPTIEKIPVDAPFRCERVTFDPAYLSSDKIVAYLYLPDSKSFSPPYQTIITMPGSYAMRGPRFNQGSTLQRQVQAALQSGRAVMRPIVWGTWERNRVDERVRLENGGYPDRTENYREAIVRISQDLGRCIDYLQTRGDIDTRRLAYHGYSWGAAVGPIFLAVETRFRVATLDCGGLLPTETTRVVDQIHFVPRVEAAVLMLNGKSDVVFPMDRSVKPMFDLLRLPGDKKTLELFDGRGHYMLPVEAQPRKTAWLDQHLGKPRSIK